MRREAAAEYDRGGRPDQARQERDEMQVLEEYLPARLDPEATRALVEHAISETGATGPSDLGKVMSHAMRAAQGRADGAQVNQLARTLLAGKGG
jgi:uncharacterized protein YqeY